MALIGDRISAPARLSFTTRWYGKILFRKLLAAFRGQSCHLSPSLSRWRLVGRRRRVVVGQACSLVRDLRETLRPSPTESLPGAQICHHVDARGMHRGEHFLRLIASASRKSRLCLIADNAIHSNPKRRLQPARSLTYTIIDGGIERHEGEPGVCYIEREAIKIIPLVDRLRPLKAQLGDIHVRIGPLRNTVFCPSPGVGRVIDIAALMTYNNRHYGVKHSVGHGSLHRYFRSNVRTLDRT